MRTYPQNLYSTKLEKLREMVEFLDVPSIVKLNQDKINNLNISVTDNEIEMVIKIKTLPSK